MAARRVLMVSPTAFVWSSETSTDNVFMEQATVNDDLRRQIVASHSAWVELLMSHGVKVQVFDHSIEHDTPDAVFPNNVFGASKKGFLTLFPMRHESRRRERRDDIIRYLLQTHSQQETLDLTHWEPRNRFLEGTGSIVIDHANDIAFVALSPRSDETVAREWIEAITKREQRDWKLVTFKSIVQEKEVYHTNVVMAIGERWAVCCFESIRDEDEKQRVRQALEGKDVVDISLAQVTRFCGNILELQGNDSKIVVCSSQAYKAFEPKQLEILSRHAKIVHSPLDDLERLGGGGIRCCIMEIFEE